MSAVVRDGGSDVNLVTICLITGMCLYDNDKIV